MSERYVRVCRDHGRVLEELPGFRLQCPAGHLAKDPNGARTWGPMSWRDARKKPCEHAVTGFVAIGVCRGEAFKVCTARKECKTHWGDEIRAAKKRTRAASAGAKTGESRYALEQKRREEENRREEALRARWKKASPAILKTIAGAVEKVRGRGVARGLLGDLVLEACGSRRGFRGRNGATPPAVGRGTSAEQLVRHAAFLILEEAASEWMAPRDFPKLAKKLGVDVAKILEAEAPEPKPEPAPAKGNSERRA